MEDPTLAGKKKKSLLLLLLALFGGDKRNAFLVLFVAGVGALTVGGAAVTGHLGSWTSKGAHGGASLSAADQSGDSSDGAAGFAASLKETQGPTPEELRLAAQGVSGKARSMRNDAVNYVGRDPKLIADAQAQAKLGSASAGQPAADGVAVGGAGYGGVGGGSLSQDGAQGAFGPGGAGSVGMSGGGQDLFHGAGFNAQSGKAALGSSVAANMPTLTAPRPGQAAVKLGRISPMKIASLNAHIAKGLSGVGTMAQGNLHPVMYQLVQTTAYTMASAMCKSCANESVAVNNRGWATGETAIGAGIIQLPGDTAAQVSQASVNQIAAGLGGKGGVEAAVNASQDCVNANNKYGANSGDLANQMAGITWSGGDPNGSLAQQPSKCCKTGNYNDMVDQWKGLCAQYNSNMVQVNQACGNSASEGQQDCTQYNHVDTCGWFSCYAMAFLGALLIIIAVVATIFTFGILGPVAAIMIGLAIAMMGFGMMANSLGWFGAGGGDGGGGGGTAAPSSGSAPSSGLGAGGGAGGGGGGAQQSAAGGVPDSGLIGNSIGGSNTGTGGQGQTNANMGQSVNVGNVKH